MKGNYGSQPIILNGMFRGVDGPGIKIGDFLGKPKYPFWLYKDGEAPLLVHDKEEEMEAVRLGFDSIASNEMCNRYLINWFWDFEDMSPKQLYVFAKEEYGVELPLAAGQERLFKAVCELSRHAPQNKNRLILMAHTIPMEYDATLAEIHRMVSPGALGVDAETISFEVEL